MGRDIYRTVGGYVLGNFVISFIAGGSAAILLYALGVPLPFALGLLVGLFDLIPLAGATIALIVVGTIAFLHSITAGIVVVVFFIVYQQLENHILQPVIYGKTVKLSPLAVLIAVLIGAALAGVIGALAAIPIAGRNPGGHPRPHAGAGRAEAADRADERRDARPAKRRPESAIPCSHAPVAQWKSRGLLSPGPGVRIPPGALRRRPATWRCVDPAPSGRLGCCSVTHSNVG